MHADSSGEVAAASASHEIQTDGELVELIDPVIQEMDKDNDGYITYPEYKSVRHP